MNPSSIFAVPCVALQPQRCGLTRPPKRIEHDVQKARRGFAPTNVLYESVRELRTGVPSLALGWNS
jgi:hypothetical protein